MKYGVRILPYLFTCLIFDYLNFTTQVRALPTVIAFKGGEPVAQFVGAIPEPKVAEFLKSV